jgi:nitrous oxidase accessory protein NosD
MHGVAGPILSLSLLVWFRVASATTVVVPPGPGTPVQDAIDAAAPGDTIRLTLGQYPEHLVINKALTLRGVRSHSTEPNGTTSVLGTCGGGPVITVAADAVQVRGIAVYYEAEGGIDATGRTRVKLRDVFVASNCPVVSAPAINVAGSTRVTLNRVWAAGASTRPVGTAGIRIADAPASARVEIGASIAADYEVGVLLENDGTASVRLSGSYVNFNDKGVVLQNTSGAIISNLRQVIDNTTSGIELDAASTGNRISKTAIRGSVTDVVDNGTGNCWHNDTYVTGSVPSCP